METKMTDRSKRVRLFVDDEITLKLDISLSFKQAKYLFKVMRLKVDDSVSVIDGKTGEYLAKVIEIGNRTGTLRILSRTRGVETPPNLWLLFSPLRKSRADFIIEKATELGVRRISPIITSRTIRKSFRSQRGYSIMIEALEQCGGTYLPKLDEPKKLTDLLISWPNDRHLMFCDETFVSKPSSHSWSAFKGKDCAAILIGPEGGFSSEESSLIKRHERTTQIGLGPRILRADTAAVSAISIWRIAQKISPQ